MLPLRVHIDQYRPFGHMLPATVTLKHSLLLVHVFRLRLSPFHHLLHGLVLVVVLMQAPLQFFCLFSFHLFLLLSFRSLSFAFRLFQTVHLFLLFFFFAAKSLFWFSRSFSFISTSLLSFSPLPNGASLPPLSFVFPKACFVFRALYLSSLLHLALESCKCLILGLAAPYCIRICLNASICCACLIFFFSSSPWYRFGVLPFQLFNCSFCLLLVQYSPG